MPRCRDCCTCQKTVQGISRAMTYVAFLFTILALSIAGWSTRCQPCEQLPNSPYVCHYMGLFEWCEATLGRQTCWDLSPRTIDRSLLVRGAYAAAQAFMVMSAILSTFYVVIDVINWFVRATQDRRKVHVIKYSQDAWFFYVITAVQGVFALVAQAIWADQRNRNVHKSTQCGDIRFRFGAGFALATLTWLLCAINIVWRIVFRKHYRDDASDAAQRQRDLQSSLNDGEFHGVSGATGDVKSF